MYIFLIIERFLSFQDDIGLGSVVGSAVFNIMLVISVCAIFAGAVRIFPFIKNYLKISKNKAPVEQITFTLLRPS